MSDRPENAYLAKLIRSIFQSINKGQDPRNGIWNNPKQPSHTVSIIIAPFTQRWRGGSLRKQNQNACWRWIWLTIIWEKMAATSVFTEHFHFSMLWHFPLCLMHVFIWIHCDITSVLIFRSTFILSLISGDAAYIQKCPLKFVHCWTFFLLFSSAQFQIVSTATVKVLLSDLLCLCTNFRLCCIHFRAADAKYVFHVS